MHTNQIQSCSRLMLVAATMMSLPAEAAAQDSRPAAAGRFTARIVAAPAVRRSESSKLEAALSAAGWNQTVPAYCFFLCFPSQRYPTSSGTRDLESFPGFALSYRVRPKIAVQYQRTSADGWEVRGHRYEHRAGGFHSAYLSVANVQASDALLAVVDIGQKLQVGLGPSRERLTVSTAVNFEGTSRKFNGRAGVVAYAGLRKTIASLVVLEAGLDAHFAPPVELGRITEGVTIPSISFNRVALKLGGGVTW